MSISSFFTLLLATTPSLQLACGGPGFTEVWAGQQTQVAICVETEAEQCQTIVNRLQAGETVIVKDPLYYAPGSYRAEFDILKDLDGEDLGLDPGLPVYLVNKIYPSADEQGWIAETWLAQAGDLVVLDDALLSELKQVYPDPDALPTRVHQGNLSFNTVLLRGCGGIAEQLTPVLFN